MKTQQSIGHFLSSSLVCLLLVVPSVQSFTSSISRSHVTAEKTTTVTLLHESTQEEEGHDNEFNLDNNRRTFWHQGVTRATAFGLFAPVTTTIVTTNNRPVWAASTRSRSDGYDVQKTDSEWKSQLSQMQYYVLREGGTERPGMGLFGCCAYLCCTVGVLGSSRHRFYAVHYCHYGVNFSQNAKSCKKFKRSTKSVNSHQDESLFKKEGKYEANRWG